MGSRALAFVRSILLLVVIVVGVPWLLVGIARSRFGGGSPLHGVSSPGDWQLGEIGQALTDRLSDQTIADVVIRCSLIVAWVAVVVLVFTVMAETVHMIRHDGLPRPDVRGLGMPQSVARLIATGLLVVVPLFGSSSKATAVGGHPLVPEQRAATTFVTDPVDVQTDVRPENVPENVWVTAAGTADRDVSGSAALSADEMAPRSAGTSHYEVRPGDSIFGIAERFAGPDPSEVSEFAEQLIELNLGSEMTDGQRFTNAAFIDVGWVLELPSPVPEPSSQTASSTAHVVVEGESLWSIAEDELGDGRRWPEIFEANEGRSFDDGRQLVDPDLIQPGWQLDVPATEAAPQAAPPTSPRPDNVWESEPTVEIPAPDSVDVDVDASGDIVDRDPADSPAETIETWGDALGDIVDGDPHASAEAHTTVGSDGQPDPPDTDTEAVADSEAPQLLTFTRAAMLSAGVLTLLAVRRRNQLRRARPRSRLPEPAPRPASTERALRVIDTGDRLDRLDVAIRSAAAALIDQGSRVVSALVGVDSEIELQLSGSASLPGPWQGSAEEWQLPASTPLELLAESAAGVGSPCPAMVQLGRDGEGRDVYVDLEACEAIEVGGPADDADAVVAAIATTLAGSVQAEVTTLIGLGVPDDAFLDHRLHLPVSDSQQAFEAAREAVGSTAAADRSTFELRSRAAAGEAWEPAVVVVGSAAGTIRPPVVRTGLAVVSASPIHGPSCRLAPDGDAWVLQPQGLRLLPIGLRPEDVAAIAELVEVEAPTPELRPMLELGPDDTVVDHDDDAAPLDASVLAEVVEVVEVVARDVDRATGGDELAGATSAIPQPTPPPDWALMVRLFGPVEVVNGSHEAVSFERSKTRELVAWLATHRTRSTRTAARTALWELDVRDATFANVVSEARRSLARLVDPPEGHEWVGRTMTEALPLHERVCTDVDVVEHALEAARLQPPAQAIATLTPAVELINGMPFEGTSYLWPDPEGITSSLVLLATSAASELAAHCLSVGDIAGVFEATGRGLQVLPGHEELIGLRMQAHARAGDHAGVRHEWESYERVITSDPWSDGEPSPKLVELRAELLNPSR